MLVNIITGISIGFGGTRQNMRDEEEKQKRKEKVKGFHVADGRR